MSGGGARIGAEWVSKRGRLTVWSSFEEALKAPVARVPLGAHDTQRC